MIIYFVRQNCITSNCTHKIYYTGMSKIKHVFIFRSFFINYTISSGMIRYMYMDGGNSFRVSHIIIVHLGCRIWCALVGAGRYQIRRNVINWNFCEIQLKNELKNHTFNNTIHCIFVFHQKGFKCIFFAKSLCELLKYFQDLFLKL